MNKQAHKHSLGLAGEFLVAGELQRRGIIASVTYGTAKKADVIALSPSLSSAVVMEVKSTSNPKWVLGNSLPDKSEKLWVLVHLPKLQTESPRYFIITSRELNHKLAPIDAKYRSDFLKKHKVKFQGKGVFSFKLEQAEEFEGKWEKILKHPAIRCGRK